MLPLSSRAGYAAALALVVLGIRWAFIGAYGTDLPEWDQWDAEGLHLLLPWFQGKPLLDELVRPHNEHYVALTKLLNLGLTLANGHWDQRLECVVNALFPALLTAGFTLWAARFTPRGITVLAGALFAVMWALPLAWHNLLSGFHSQQFFLVVLSFGTIAWLPFAAPWSGRWWCGAACAVLALGSMASGFLAAAAALAILALRGVLRETTLRRAWPAAVVAIAVCAVGLVTRHEVDYHAAAKAKTLQDFVLTIAQGLQWPAPGSPWLGALMWLPWAWLLGHLLLHRQPAAAREHAWRLVAIGLWIWLQLIATAYARGAGGPAPAWRYLDTLIFGSCANLLAFAWLGLHGGYRRPVRAGVGVLALAWLAMFGIGAGQLTRHVMAAELPRLRLHYDRAIIQTRAYLATGDRSHLNHPDIPYPGAESFAQRLSHPELVRLLPPSVRTGYDPSRPDAPAAEPTAPLSRIAWHLSRGGEWLAGAGALLALAAAVRVVRSAAARAKLFPATPSAASSHS